MPTRFIHSRSFVMPSLVTFPPVQCHHVRGLAASGGCAKPADRSSARAAVACAVTTNASSVARTHRSTRVAYHEGMARKPAAAAHASQADFLVLSLMSAIVPMIEAKCGALNKRDTNTLKRHVEK